MKKFILKTFIAMSMVMNVHASSLTLEDAAAKLDPFIEAVFLCGRWEHQGESGVFRVVHGYLWGHTELYVQWLADPVWYPEKGKEARQAPLVMSTATFPELNNYEAATTLQNVKCLKKGGQWMITADADNANDDVGSKFRLSIYLYDQPGKFRLIEKPVPNQIK